MPYLLSRVHEQDLQGMALACCKAAAALHKVGVVHCDFRLENVVKISETAWMVIDLEHCRLASQPLPPGHQDLANWDNNTTQVRSTRRRGGDVQLRIYDKESDMYQIGKMLGQLMSHMQVSDDGKAFVAQLRQKELSASAALDHTWLQV